MVLNGRICNTGPWRGMKGRSERATPALEKEDVLFEGPERKEESVVGKERGCRSCREEYKERTKDG